MHTSKHFVNLMKGNENLKILKFPLKLLFIDTVDFFLDLLSFMNTLLMTKMFIFKPTVNIACFIKVKHFLPLRFPALSMIVWVQINLHWAEITQRDRLLNWKFSWVKLGVLLNFLFEKPHSVSKTLQCTCITIFLRKLSMETFLY